MQRRLFAIISFGSREQNSRLYKLYIEQTRSDIVKSSMVVKITKINFNWEWLRGVGSASSSGRARHCEDVFPTWWKEEVLFKMQSLNIASSVMSAAGCSATPGKTARRE